MITEQIHLFKKESHNLHKALLLSNQRDVYDIEITNLVEKYDFWELLTKRQLCDALRYVDDTCKYKIIISCKLSIKILCMSELVYLINTNAILNKYDTAEQYALVIAIFTNVEIDQLLYMEDDLLLYMLNMHILNIDLIDGIIRKTKNTTYNYVLSYYPNYTAILEYHKFLVYSTSLRATWINSCITT